jgi:hypothetical protein
MMPKLDRRALDLGRDREWVTDQDARRQNATVDWLLRTFYGPEAKRRELQLLADEVGLGKTFVALATAYSVLDAMRGPEAREDPDWRDCYRAVLVITPAGNHALSSKWEREVGAMCQRCSKNSDLTSWFKGKFCHSVDELLDAVGFADDRRRKAPPLLVAEASVFTKRLSDPAVRFLTACLFRWWGNGMLMRERYSLVRGIARTTGSWAWWDRAKWVGRGEYEVDPWDWKGHESFLEANDAQRARWPDPGERRIFAEVSLDYARLARALDRWSRDGGDDDLEGLRQLCKDAPQRFTEDGSCVEQIDSIKSKLRDVYKALWPYLLEKRFPLVIADEAHHWRNQSRLDCKAFRNYIAPFAKRLLLLTATPFQLRPEELSGVLSMSDAMKSIGQERREELKSAREEIAERMQISEDVGRAFAREWGALGDQIAGLDPALNGAALGLPTDIDERTQQLASSWDRIRGTMGTECAHLLDSAPGPLRPFLKRAVFLREANQHLRNAMRPLIVRHRRGTAHRRYWVGREYPPDKPTPRPDRSQLHLAPGRPVSPSAELVQFLLMKVVAEITCGRHRTAIGSALTGCYRTLWASNEGRRAMEAGAQAELRDLLKKLASPRRDGQHPKVEAVVKEVLRRWEEGEKSLIFCFRKPTAEVLRNLLARGVDDRLRAARKALFATRGTTGGSPVDPDKAMQQFRRALTARDRVGVSLFLDRVLFGWLVRSGAEPPGLLPEDREAVAGLCARAIYHGRPLFADLDRLDRVFLNRAVEHVLAKRISDSLDPQCRALLEEISRENWVRFRYGQAALSQGGNIRVDDQPAERAARGSLAAAYSLLGEPDPTVLQRLRPVLHTRPGRADVLDSIIAGPNLFLPLRGAWDILGSDERGRVESLQDLLFRISRWNGDWAWAERARVVDAVVRAFLREDILFRLPQSVFRGNEKTWAERLCRGFHQSRPSVHQLEPMAGRVLEFVKEIAPMSPEERDAHLKYAMDRNAESVVLVTGDSKLDRDKVFSGFNTPLLPEILICTAVGQEGIDLQRQCRHVVHYDLGWNPATMEQRTGRVDRIGSKTFREIAIAQAKGAVAGLGPGLDIGVPYLAGTYDERIFETLRGRAQIFDILTGGDPTADRNEEALWLNPDDEGDPSTSSYVPLPPKMLEDLRVNLEIGTKARSSKAAN